MSFNLSNGSLPACYGRDYLVLLVQDPFNLYAYWEITPERLALAANYLGEAPESLTLAIRLVQRGTAGVREIARGRVEDLCGQRYFNNLAPGEAYQAEVGVLRDGNFFTLLCSAQAILPGVRGKPQTPPGEALPAFPPAFFARS